MLGKLDQVTEQVVRKVERQFHELNDSTDFQNLQGFGNDDFEDENEMVLEVEEVPTLQYLETFGWNSAKYPVSRQVDELSGSIQKQATKLEEELKESSIYLAEKKQVVQQLQRRKQGNLAMMDIDEVITKEVILEHELVDSEYIKDVAMLVQKNNEKSFLSDYETFANASVIYSKQKSGTDGEAGSPVVPCSAIKLSEDAEYVVYAIKLLRNYVSEVKKDALSKRYMLKSINFSLLRKGAAATTQQGELSDMQQLSTEENLEIARDELLSAVSQLRRWCQAHYGEAFSAWVHVKALRVFVESALRYGLPTNYSAVLVKLKKSSVKSKARKVLYERYKQLDDYGMSSMKETEASNTGGIGLSLDEMFPYVSFEITAFASRDR